MKKFRSMMIATAFLLPGVVNADNGRDIFQLENVDIIGQKFTSISTINKQAFEDQFIQPTQNAKAAKENEPGFFSQGLEYIGRTLVAYNTAYYSTKLSEEVISYGMYGAVGLATGSVAAGSGAYYTVKTGFNIASYVLPGYEGLIAGVTTPFFKTITDRVLDKTKENGPNTVKKSVNFLSNTSKNLWNFVSTTASNGYEKLKDQYSAQNE